MHDLPDMKGATVAFDLDGTLVDSLPDLAGALNALLLEEGLLAVSLEDARTMVGAGAWKLVQRGFARSGEILDESHKPRLFTRFREIYAGCIADLTRPFPGCLEALDALAAAGATLVVCTNKLTGLSVALLDALQMTHRFAAVIGPDSAPAAKPDARHLLTAIAAAGGSPERAVLVGDSGADFHAARNAGVPIVLVPFGYSDVDVRTLGADEFCETFDQIPSACARLLSARGAQAIDPLPA